MALLSSRHCPLRAGALLLGLAVLAGACRKEAPAPDAPTGQLASHPWRLLTFADTDNTTKPPTTTFPAFASYRLDDTYQFNADGGLVFDDGARRAASTDAQVSTGSWQFQNAQASLAITLRRAVTLGTTGLTSTTSYDVLKLSADTLRLRTGTQAQTLVVTLVK